MNLLKVKHKNIDYKKKKMDDSYTKDGMHHYVKRLESRRRCAECGKKTSFGCSKCNIGLDIDCFEKYHS